MELTSHGIEAKVRTLAGNLLGRDGYDLVDVEYKRDVSGWTLTLFIDKEGGVSLEDCQRVSRVVGTLLDVEDPIPHHYALQVSSPGLDRPLTRPADYRAALNRSVRITTREPIGNRRNFTGILIRIDREGPGDGPEPDAGRTILHLRDDAGAMHELSLESVRRANIVYQWPETTSAAAGRMKRRSGRNR